MNPHIKVRQIPKDTGPAGWNQILPAAKCYPELNEHISADWVVVGGGYAGMAAARRLSQLCPDESIVLLEACRLAEGPAGRNSGFMIDLPHDLNSESYAGAKEQDLKQIRLNRHAIQFAADMAQEYRMPPMVFSQSGRITAAGTERGVRHIDSYASHLTALGEPYQLLDNGQMKQRTGTDFYRKGLFTPGAAMIQPAAFIRMAAKGLHARVAIYENSPVQAMNLGDQHQLMTPKGSVKARRVILAVNGHIQSFGFYPGRLLHLFTFASMTRKLTQEEVVRLGGEANWGVIPADPMGTTVRRVSDYLGSGNRLTVRNRFTLNQSMEISAKQLEAVKSAHMKAYKARFPMLSNVAMEHCWGGRLCLSWNSVPAFGELEERVYSAACQNGLGTVKGTLSGLLAAELATGHRSSELEEYLAYSAPSRLPPEPFLSLGANTQLRWKEWLAGSEL